SAPGGIAFALPRADQSRGELRTKLAEVAFDAAFAANQDMIVIGQAFVRERSAKQLAEAALHAVANDRVADLLGDGYAEALALPAIGPRQQDKAGPRNAQTAVGGKEVSPLAEDLDGGCHLGRNL